LREIWGLKLKREKVIEERGCEEGARGKMIDRVDHLDTRDNYGA
jgi:hypothetical protein